MLPNGIFLEGSFANPTVQLFMQRVKCILYGTTYFAGFSCPQRRQRKPTSQWHHVFCGVFVLPATPEETENSMAPRIKRFRCSMFIFIVFSQSTCLRPDTLPCVFCNRSYRVTFFFTFWYPSQLKHLVLRAFLAGHLPKKLSKICVLDERGIKK